MFACYALALSIVVILAQISRHASAQYASRLMLLSWLITKFWRMGFPDLSAGYFILDAALITEFTRQFLKTRLPLFRNLVLLHLCFPIIHIVGMLTDTSTYFLGAQRSDYWMQAFMRNRVFDLILLYLMWFSVTRIWLLNSPGAQARHAKQIEELEKRLKRVYAWLRRYLPALR